MEDENNKSDKKEEFSPPRDASDMWRVRIQEKREAGETSYGKIAKSLGVSRQAVTKWIRGDRSPPWSRMPALAKAADIPLMRFLHGLDYDDDGTLENVPDIIVSDRINDAVWLLGVLEKSMEKAGKTMKTEAKMKVLREMHRLAAIYPRKTIRDHLTMIVKAAK